ncbi:hypothetical protein KAH27_05935 [bacterium]|nr:hypothetical protein [bacterium]
MINKITKAVMVFFIFMSTHIVSAATITNATENLSLKANDISFNFFTLTFSGNDFSIFEKAPVSRQVLNVGKVKISLELARSLFLWRFQLDCFAIENIYVSILEDNDGNIYLFNKSIKQKEIDELFSTETNKQAETKTEIDLSIPEMEIKNLNIICHNHDNRNFLWSINNLNLYIRNFFSPPDKNKELWNVFISANFNGKTNNSILFSAKCRTIPDNSFLKLNIAANNIDLKTINMIVDSGKKTGNNSKIVKVANAHKNKNGSSPFDAIFDCFSNEINRISTAFNEKISEAKLNQNVTNFLNNVNVSNLVFNFNWDMTVSNHCFKSGNINLEIIADKTNLPPLIYEYIITNSTDLLVK